MSTTFQENLEERIERIRKSDELIEKKHREAEADRLRALKDNAMVKIKSPSDENWPRVHKYDNLDFTYDVKIEDSGDLLISAAVDDNGKRTSDGQTINKSGRQYKQFADGDGPPPDPFYNFLADSSRDGSGNNNNGTAAMPPSTIDNASNNSIDEKPIRNKVNHNNNNNNNANNNNNNNNNFRNRNVPSNNSFKNRNNNKEKSGNNTPIANNHNNHNNQSKSGGAGGGHGQSKKSDGNYNSWKNERERIDEARLSRQKSNEGKWKREWDNNKLNGDGSGGITIGTDHKSNNSFTNNINNNNNYAINNNSNNNNNNSHINRPIVKPKSPPNSNVNVSQMFKPKFADLTIEHRGNITVSVSKDGEVKSVKLQSPKVIGTGRVGPRHQNVQGNFTMPSNDMKHETSQLSHPNQSTLIMQQASTGADILAEPPSMFLIPRNSVQDRLDRLRQQQHNSGAASATTATF